MHKILPLLVALAPATFLLRANAQGDAPAPAASTSTSASAPALPPPVPTSAPVEKHAVVETHPSEVIETPKPKNETDHDKVVGRFGIGYFGQYDVPMGFGTSPSGVVPNRAPTEATQLIGVRYWWSRVRLDVAFGWNVGSGSQTVASTKSDQTSTLVLSGRVALPFALLIGEHYTFILGPELAYGQGGETVPGRTSPVPGAVRPADTTHKGRRITVGARAGAEIQFGFIGIPHLALDATVGLGLDVTSGETTGPSGGTGVPGDPQPTVSADFTRTTVRSSAQHQPWNIFFSNVAAVYYF